MSATETQRTRDGHPRVLARPPAGLPRLLAGVDPSAAMGLERHLELHGALPRARRARAHRRARASSHALIDEVERAGLLGRGGATFPLARKLRLVGGSRGRPLVVANGVEAEPASFKDRVLLETLPHLVLDGAELAAEAVGAERAILAVRHDAGAAADALAVALAERPPGGVPFTIEGAPTRFLAGQESALIDFLDGGAGKPRHTPPLPGERGLQRRPTLVSNVETLAHLALVARHGAAWYRQLGEATQPGSTLVTISGPLAEPGVYEIEHGASLTSVVAAAGGYTAPVRGALVGGYGGTWIAAGELSGVNLANEQLARHRARLGAGLLVFLSDEACPVAETARLTAWLAAQSAHQCGPCEHGLDALSETIAQIAAGAPPPRAGARLEQLRRLIEGRGACHHPDGAVSQALSAVRAFAEDFAAHARRGACARCARPPELPLPGATWR